MRLVPQDNLGKIQFYETHLAPWLENASAIGTSPEMVASLADIIAEARDAYTAQALAQQAAQAATQRMQNALDKMTSMGAVIILQIRAKGSQAGDSIYPLASIPGPASASRMAPPGQPTNFTMELQQIGWLTLEWTCKNPRGSVRTMYQLRRGIDGGPIELLATVGARKFVDRSVPMGTTSITYQVRAVRSTAVGPTATYNVSFGSMRGGKSTAPASGTVRESRAVA